jgi:2',3'-cyclic-nucleotide 2'-phosphodiesterase/3'-nucleotidase
VKLKYGKKTVLGTALTLGLIVPQVAPSITYADVMNSSVVDLRIMETTDIHTNIVNYDYFQDHSVNSYGYAYTASLIKQARTESPNNLLFDNGDLIQGTLLADYVSKETSVQNGTELHPSIKALNQLGYDVGNYGNHEFNYGLPYLENVMKNTNYKMVNANVYKIDNDNDPNNDVNYFKPYEILNKVVKDQNGVEQTLKVGVIGFVPPQITKWDEASLRGKAYAKDIIETANKFIPQMKAAGADVIVAIPHSGMGLGDGEVNGENVVKDLSKVKGIDAILFGHAHAVFPSKAFAGDPSVDNTNGTINGVAAVEPGFWGDHLGIIDMKLEHKDGKWSVLSTQSEARSILGGADGKTPIVQPDQAILDSVKSEHEATIDYARSPVGEISAPITSYFALVKDDPSVQVVTNAQKWYLEKNVQGTELEGLPILSAGAPFKAGGRSGVDYYTDIPTGKIALKNVADLYYYGTNTIKAVKIKGSDVKEWLEMSAGQFNQIDPKNKSEQQLINNDFPTYNYDVIDGVTYKIDVTEPPKYDKTGKVVSPYSNRIKKLMYKGKPIDPNQDFLVVTNNYRAGGGGNFPGINASKIVVDSPDSNQDVVKQFILDQKTLNPSADNNWSFAPVHGKVNVVFQSSPKAQTYIKPEYGFKYIGDGGEGFAKYSIDLKKHVSKVHKDREHKNKDHKDKKHKDHSEKKVGLITRLFK